MTTLAGEFVIALAARLGKARLIDNVVVTVRGTDVDADVGVRVAWSAEEGRAVILGDGLDEAPDGEAYELWLIDADGTPVPMDLLDPAEGGDIGEVVSIDAAPAAWGVTIEPEGGSPAPSGEILFLGTV